MKYLLIFAKFLKFELDCTMPIVPKNDVCLFIN